MLSVGVFVFDVTGSAFQVAVITMLRMLPLAALGMFSGVIGERLDRRVMLLVGHLIMCVVSLALALLAIQGKLELWHIGVGAILNGIFWTTDFSARRPIIADVAGLGRIGQAMALDSITNNGTRMLGPLVGGFLLEVLGIGGAFVLSTILYLVGMGVLFTFEYSDKSNKSEPALRSLVEGFRHLKGNKPLIGVLMVTVIFNLWGYPFTSMIPVVGRDLLELGPFLTGLLASAEGAGAVLGATAIAAYSTSSVFARLYVYGTGLYLVSIIVFAFSTIATLSGIILLVTGVAGAAFATMQSTLVILHSPPEVRSRMMGVLSMCIGTGPIGFLILGAMANSIGVPPAMFLSAFVGLLALFLAGHTWPDLSHRDPAVKET